MYNAIEKAKQMLTEEHKITANKLMALEVINEKLADFPHELAISFGCGNSPWSLDIDHPSREVTIELLKHLQAGTWTKELSGAASLNYINKTAYPFMVRIYAAEPPESCRIITEEVEVPEVTIPAHKTTQTRLECNPV